MAFTMPPIASSRAKYAKAPPLHIERQPFDEIRAAQRIDGIGDTRFICEDLLRAQCNPRRILGGQCQRFVKAIGVQ